MKMKKNVLPRLLPYLKKSKGPLLLALLSALVSVALSLLSPLLVGQGSFELVQEEFAKQVDKRERIAEEASSALEYAFDFMEQAFGEGQEMLVFVTELAMGPASNAFITENGCERYYKYNKDLLLDSRRAELNRQINANLTRDTERGLSVLPQGMQ